jgi:transcription initiation factor TFIIF subunit beta
VTNLTRRSTTDKAEMAEEVKHLETRAAERPVWLMKCPTVVSRAWQEAAAAATSNPEAGGANPNPNPVVAKVVLSLDPLRDEQPTKASLLPSLLLHPLVSACISVPD